MISKPLLAIAGPYSATTEEVRKQNLDRMNEAAVLVYQKGYIPIIGVHAALPVVEKSDGDKYETIMDISLAVVNCCEGIPMVGESPGANRERDLIASKQLPVFFNINEIPDLTQ
jgi:hypothetical protein